MDKMRTVLLEDIGIIKIENVSIPKIKENEVLIKVKTAGICRTDIDRVWLGGSWDYPITLGHEFCGTVAKLGGNVTNLEIGDLITVNPMITCGKCIYCKSGYQNLCTSYDHLGITLDGCFADYVKIPANSAVKIPNQIDTDCATIIDPVAICTHAIYNADIKYAQAICIIGCGTLGNILIQLCKNYGVENIIAIDVSDYKLNLAKISGADICLNSTNDKVFERVNKITNGSLCNIVFEAAGVQNSLRDSIKVASKLGKIIALGRFHSDITLKEKDMEFFLKKELTLKSSWHYNYGNLDNEWQLAINMQLHKKLNLAGIITHKFALNDIKQAFDMAKIGSKEHFNKILIEIDTE